MRLLGVVRQIAYNTAHGITPTTIIKEIRDKIGLTKVADDGQVVEVDYETMTRKERQAAVKTLTEQMNEAAGNLDYELAAQIRDTILEIKAMD